MLFRKKTKTTSPRHIVLSRTDSIGDVVLTLPMAGLLKKQFPHARISFIGNNYTQSVVALSGHIDGFVNWDLMKAERPDWQLYWMRELDADWLIHVFPNHAIARLARKAGVRNQVGTSHRWFHWLTCKHLVHYSRRRSDRHESQLNCRLLAPLGICTVPELSEMQAFFGLTNLPEPPQALKNRIDPDRFNLILHPRSRGSAREWGEANFENLINLLPQDRFKVFITGTREEGFLLEDFLHRVRDQVTDLTGRLELRELIAFLTIADGLVAASTGPLHLAAALGKKTIGLFAPMRPIHPGRWAPLGTDAHALAAEKDCNDCRNSQACKCIQAISPEVVKQFLMASF